MIFPSTALLKRVFLSLFLLILVACTDPLDRQQGEPSAFEESDTQNTPAGEGY